MQPVTRPVANATPSDPVVETQVFWMEYRTHIMVALAVILAALAAYGGYRYYQARQEAAAAALLSNAKAPPDYQKLISDHPGAAATASAYLLLAEAQRKEQKLEAANTTLQEFIQKYPKHEFVTTAQMAMAANHDSLGKPDHALQVYGRVASEHPRSFNAPLALLSQVVLLKQNGQIDEARRVCETLITQYRESFASQEAQRYLRTLKPGSAPSAAAPPVSEPAPSIAPAQASPPPAAAPTP